MRDVVEEIDGEFVLPLEGLVSRGFQGRADGVELLLRSEDWRDDARLVINDEAQRPRSVSFAVDRSPIEKAVVSSVSSLRVMFADGALLEVAAGENEEWELQGPGGIHVVAPVGGGKPAIWDATTPRYLVNPNELEEEQ